jgi:cytochrome c biogenesis protein CcdA
VKERLTKLALFGVPIGLVVAALLILISVQAGAETFVADLAAWLPLSWAFAAGMVASVNPCGFLMLPTFVSYHLGTQEAGYYARPALERARQALGLGFTATAGFLVILAVAGAIIAAGGQWLIRVFPYAGVAIGVGMGLLGIYLLLTHKTLGILVEHPLNGDNF